MSTLSTFHQLKQQHQAYFSIVNDPALLTEYAVEFFGPEGEEPLLSYTTQDLARSRLLQQCEQWSMSCITDQRLPVFVQEGADYSMLAEHELENKVSMILDVIEDPESLLGFLAKAFGPSGPEGLAITDENQWQELDNLFLCRMPYPNGFQSSQKTPPRPPSVYRNTHCCEDNIDVAQSPILTVENRTGLLPATIQRANSQELIISAKEHRSQTRCTANHENKPEPVIDPEVLGADRFQTSQADPRDQGLSPMQMAGLCALCLGAGAIGGLVIASLGRGITTKAGAEAFGAIGSIAMGGFRRAVFTGPRGGRYTITSSGTKSYNVA